MRRVLVFIAVVAMALLIAGTASAAAPRIVLVSGSPLPRPVAISDWNRILSLLSAVNTARVVPRSELAKRPRSSLAMSWGPSWSPWQLQKVFWYVAPSYTGPVLIRDRRLDGPEWLRFEGGTPPSPELRIWTDDTVFWAGQPAGSRGRPSSVRARASGCYGAQIDGTTFSRTVIFHIELAR